MTDNIYKNYLAENFDIDKNVLDYVEDCEGQLKEWFDEADQIMGIAQMRVLKAFQDNHVNDTHFGWNTGYGYDDAKPLWSGQILLMALTLFQQHCLVC